MTPALALRGGRGQPNSFMRKGVRQSQRQHVAQFMSCAHGFFPTRGHPMSKRARKRRSRKGNKANHGRRPNA